MILQIFILICIVQFVFSEDPAHYYLHTADGKFKHALISATNGSEIDFSEPLVFIIHGWIQRSKTRPYVELTKAYNSIGKNVILVDWGTLADDSYLKSMRSTRMVGNNVGMFLINLLNYGMDPSKLHLIGHSLGAHIAGFAGKYFNKLSNRKVRRITGLDPAGWGFYKLIPFDNKLCRIDEDDADLVVILNTSVLYGLSRDVGTVTFYANNGIYQPGCPFDDDPNTKPIFCNHHRSLSYMIESIFLKNFVGKTRCTSNNRRCKTEYLTFDEDIPCEAKGTYYFETNMVKPYGKG